MRQFTTFPCCRRHNKGAADGRSSCTIRRYNNNTAPTQPCARAGFIALRHPPLCSPCRYVTASFVFPAPIRRILWQLVDIALGAFANKIWLVLYIINVAGAYLQRSLHWETIASDWVRLTKKYMSIMSYSRVTSRYISGSRYVSVQSYMLFPHGLIWDKNVRDVCPCMAVGGLLQGSVAWVIVTRCHSVTIPWILPDVKYETWGKFRRKFCYQNRRLNFRNIGSSLGSFC